jgi:hypothetical protein
LQELQYLSSGGANGEKTINSLLDASSACSAPVTG